MSIDLLRLHYFVCSSRLMFSCNLRIWFIRQRHEGRSVRQHGCVVLIYNGVSEYSVAVAVAPAVKALNVV